MTTTRERALEAALQQLISACGGTIGIETLDRNGSLGIRAVRDARAALALPPSQPEIDEELLGHTKTALAEHAKLYAINADMLAALRHIMLWAEGTNHSACANVARVAIARATGRED